jgi:hypothetical protein
MSRRVWVRRLGLLFAAGFAVKAKERLPKVPLIPVDPERINNFAKEFNIFTRALQDGLVDVKQWDKVEESWKKLRE